jgi:hypothetical protein
LIIVPASLNEKVGDSICHPQQYMYSRVSRPAGNRLQETLYFFLIFYCAGPRLDAQIGDIVGMSAKMVEGYCKNADMRSNSRAALTHLDRAMARQT